MHIWASIVALALCVPAGPPARRPPVAVPAAPAAPAPAQPSVSPPADPPAEPILAPSIEEEATLSALMASDSWIRRMVAAQRLERWPTNGFAAMHLTTLAHDKDARVRANAIVGLTRVGAKPLEDRLQLEDDGRVIRTMLRCGWQLDAERVEKGARPLLKSDVQSERLLGVEIICALNQQGRAPRSLASSAHDTLLSIIARLQDEDAGALSPRLANLTGGPDARSDFKWRTWLSQNRISLSTKGGSLVPPAGADTSNAVTKLTSEEFVRFAAALNEAFKVPIDLGIAIDCTASMSSEIAQAQGGINDVMLFAGAAAGGARVAIVGYRDHGDDWTIKATDFTASRAQAQTNLWKLSASGGGDEAELVYEALRVAYGQFTWRTGPKMQRVLVLIGDAPPHPGFGAHSVELARKAKEAGITTFIISARSELKEEAKHFVEIARAGGGRVIRLSKQHDLAAELAGLTLADTWHDPIVDVFERYLLVCR